LQINPIQFPSIFRLPQSAIIMGNIHNNKKSLIAFNVL